MTIQEAKTKFKNKEIAIKMDVYTSVMVDKLHKITERKHLAGNANYYYLNEDGTLGTSYSGKSGAIDINISSISDGTLPGYKSPVKLYGIIEAGTLFIKRYPNDNWYYPSGNAVTQSVPAELVETWEPVCKIETITKVLGTSKIEFKITKDEIRADGTTFEIGALKILHSALSATRNVGSDKYRATISKIQVGCSEFTVAELKYIIDTYDSLNDVKPA